MDFHIILSQLSSDFTENQIFKCLCKLILLTPSIHFNHMINFDDDLQAPLKTTSPIQVWHRLGVQGVFPVDIGAQ